MQKNITIIGGGVAGMESAKILSEKGFQITLVEATNQAGGNVTSWDRLFPNKRKASEVYQPMLANAGKDYRIIYGEKIQSLNKNKQQYSLHLTSGEILKADAVLIATGFKLFNAFRKEEYGYGIYDNVITSSDLERMMHQGKIQTTKGESPKRVAFVHCVGSRDEKVGNTYCSKVCCATAVKQATEVKELLPEAEVYCLYMDLRMYDRYFEDLYREAQEKFGVNFIRGRLSEAAENHEGRIVIKTEDTLIGKPIKFSVDLLVLMVGMEAAEQSSDLATLFHIRKGDDQFFVPQDEHVNFNTTQQKGVFLSGTCKGPKNIAETLADSRSACEAIVNYLNEI